MHVKLYRTLNDWKLICAGMIILASCNTGCISDYFNNLGDAYNNCCIMDKGKLSKWARSNMLINVNHRDI